jgi:hypothetical protein
VSEPGGYGFRARDVSSDADRAWLRDPLSDALAPVHHAGFGTAIGAPAGDGPWLFHGDWVWMARRSPGELVRRHHEDGQERRSTHGVLQMAASERAAWAMTAERELLILPPDGSDPVAIGHAPANASVLLAHHGRLWLSPGRYGARASIACVDAVDATVLARREVQSFTCLHVNDAGAWVEQPIEIGGEQTLVLRELDPETLRDVRAQAWPATIRVYAMIGQVAVCGRSSGRPLPKDGLDVVWLDARSGERLGLDKLDPRIKAVGKVVAPPQSRHAVALAYGTDRSQPEVIAFGASPEQTRLLQPSGIDLAHLPAPRPPHGYEHDEADVHRRIRAEFVGQDLIREITVEDVWLRGAWPDTEVVVRFRECRRPEWLFARRLRVWVDDGRVIADHSVAFYNLMEDVQACGYGLPANPVPDDDDIVWF